MNNTFGSIISYLRKEKGISQKQASSDLGISQALLSHYEKGIRECGLDFVVKVADYYNVSCDYLLGRTSERDVIAINEGTKKTITAENPSEKIIMDSIDFTYRILSEMNHRDITRCTTEMLMCSIYNVIRLLYRNNNLNNEEFFTLTKESCNCYSESTYQHRKGRLTDKINEFSKSRRNENKVYLSYDIINKKYDDIASSVFNLVHNTERIIKK